MTPISATYSSAPSDVVSGAAFDSSADELWALLDRKSHSTRRSRRPIIAVLGLGYVGLPTAVAMAGGAYDVLGIDVSRHRLDAIEAGRVDLLPEDSVRLGEVLRRSSLELHDQPARLHRADAVVICVPTPVDPHLVPDLSFVESACRTAVEHARAGQTIILTSTTCVGTTRRLLVEPLVARGLTPGRDIFVAFSPERIDPGNGDRPQGSVPRVLGGATPMCSMRALAIIGQVAPTVHPVSSLEAAEFTKLYENTFRAVNIAFANEMAEMSRVLDLDVMEVIEAASTKPYGFMPFYPGSGVGGHCIPCDPHYLLWQMRAQRHQSRLVEEAMSGIAARPGRVVQRAMEVLAADGRAIAGASVLVVGVSYKPGVEDVRGSPAVEVIESLRAQGAAVQYHDRLVPELRLADGSVLRSVDRPELRTNSLVIVHVLQPGSDVGWLDSCPLVLDATYRLNVPHRAVL